MKSFMDKIEKILPDSILIWVLFGVAFGLVVWALSMAQGKSEEIK